MEEVSLSDEELELFSEIEETLGDLDYRFWVPVDEEDRETLESLEDKRVLRSQEYEGELFVTEHNMFMPPVEDSYEYWFEGAESIELEEVLRGSTYGTFRKHGIETIGDVLEYIEEGNALSDLNGVAGGRISEVVTALEEADVEYELVDADIQEDETTIHDAEASVRDKLKRLRACIDQPS